MGTENVVQQLGGAGSCVLAALLVGEDPGPAPLPLTERHTDYRELSTVTPFPTLVVTTPHRDSDHG